MWVVVCISFFASAKRVCEFEFVKRVYVCMHTIVVCQTFPSSFGLMIFFYIYEHVMLFIGGDDCGFA